MENFFDFEVQNNKGQLQKLSDFKGQVVLVVNVASKCGYTPQYQGLEKVYRLFKDRGFTIVAFPCNQFGFQEPGNDSEILGFCEDNYEVTFPLMSKVNVNGEKAAPVYRFLKEQAPGILGTEMIKWNFTKFLVSREGNVLKRYSTQTEPAEIVDDIEAALTKGLL